MLNSNSLKEIEINTYRNCQLKILSLLDSLKIDSDSKILDIGCGDGSFSFEVAKTCHAKEVCGLDIDKISLEKAKKKGVKAYKWK